MRTPTFAIPVATAVVLLAGCGDGEHGDVKAWMAEASKDMQGRVQSIPEIKSFPIISYDAGDFPEPFSPSKVITDKCSGKPEECRGVDFDRPREPLEAYPLESLRMVGVMRNGRQPHALIQADNMVYQVRVGNHIGQNLGVITSITDTQVSIKELVQDPTDQTPDWVERVVTLGL
jgi:type IV pilus assembly protein PilP